MFKGVDHVVIAVKDLESGIAQFEEVYGVAASDVGEPVGASFRNAFFRFGPDAAYLELVAPTNESGPVGRRLATSGEGVYLIAVQVDDLVGTVADLRANGVRLLGDPGPDRPITGQVFIHPSAVGGVLTQLVQR